MCVYKAVCMCVYKAVCMRAGLKKRPEAFKDYRGMKL